MFLANSFQRLEEIAQKNKITAAAQYKAWVQTFTPVEVNEANNARQTLKRKYNIPKNSLKLIDDDRQPKRPRTAYAIFTKARWASGDLGNKVTDAAKAIGREWRSLSDNEKQVGQFFEHSNHVPVLMPNTNLAVLRSGQDRSGALREGREGHLRPFDQGAQDTCRLNLHGNNLVPSARASLSACLPYR